MACVIGTDEAGYGPNLGPLVVAATVWRVGGDRPLDALLDQLAALRAGADGLIGDSKRLYTPGGRLASIERGVLAALGCSDAPASCGASWRALLGWLDPQHLAALADLPWHAAYDADLPVDAPAGAIAAARARLAAALGAAGGQLVGLRARVVFPAEFNARVAECHSKGTALSLWTLELVRDLLAGLEDQAILVQCDKHGGRNRYGALLQHVFAAPWVEVCEESRAASAYRWDSAGRRVEARFTARGERFVPAALASMTAKYVRELAMRAFNEFWLARVPGLRPTAGYPTDAQRFHAAIRPVQQQLGIADAMLWRER